MSVLHWLLLLAAWFGAFGIGALILWALGEPL